jgi:hypothetical protein
MMRGTIELGINAILPPSRARRFEGFRMDRETSLVNSVSEFVSTIVQAHRRSIRTRTQNVSSSTLYRGQADAEWAWSPRLYRDGLFGHERTLILDLLKLRPSDFAGLSDFEALAKMQHFGLPTRLLDMTRNPLVGLYFACASETHIDRDGSVAVFPHLPVLRNSNPHVEVIARFAVRHQARRVRLGSVLTDIKSLALIHQDAAEVNSISDLRHLLEVPFYAVDPSYSNERIDRQAGAFLMLGMEPLADKSTDRTPALIEYGPLTPAARSRDLWKNSFELVVPAAAKRDVLQELSLLGITRASLFPDLANQAATVLETVLEASPP